MAAEDTGSSNAGFEGVLRRVDTTTLLEQLQAEMHNLNQFAISEQALTAPLNTSEQMWISAGEGVGKASTDLSNYSNDLLTTWRSDGDSELFAAASQRSTTSLRQAQGTMAGGEGTNGISTMVRELADSINATGEYNAREVARLEPLFLDARTHMTQMRAGSLGAYKEEQIRLQEKTYLDQLRPSVQQMGQSLQALNSYYGSVGPQISAAASGLKWDGPGADNTLPGGGPGGPRGIPAAAGTAGGPGGAPAGGPSGGPADALAGGPAAELGGPTGGPAGGLGEPAGGLAGGLGGGLGVPAGGPAGGLGGGLGGPAGGPAGGLGGPAGGPAGGLGGTELSRLSPGGVPPVPTLPGGVPGGPTPPALPNGGLPLPPTGLAPLPAIGSAVNGSGAANNRPRVPGVNPLPPVGRGGLGTIGSGGLGSSGINGGAGIGGLRGGGGELGLGNLRGGGGDLGLGKAGADIRGDQMIPRAGDQSVAPNQAGTSRAPTSPGTPLGTTAAGAAGGTPSGAPPMMPPMGGAGAGGGNGRGGKPGTGAIRPVNRKRKRQDDNTPGVPVGLRGKAGRELPGAFPMLPVNNRRRKDERDKAVDTIELLDEELWKVEEAEAVETKRRVGRLAT